MSDKIPPEIWFYIAEFIPNEAIYRRLRTISSLFFHLAMDIKYQEVYIQWNTIFHTFPRIISRLSDPFVARKVRRLIVEFTNYTEATTTSPLTDPATLIGKMFHWLSSSRRFLPPFKGRNMSTLKAIARCIKSLPNMVNFEITTKFGDGFGAQGVPPKLLRHLSSTASPFSDNLQSLFILADPAVLEEMAIIKPCFQNLTSLQISIVPLVVDHSVDVQSNPGLATLASFINNISPKLRRLRLAFIGFYQLPDVFAYLSNSLTLESLELMMNPLKNASRGDAGLKAFLCGTAHALRELDLHIESGFSDLILSKLLLDCAVDGRCFSNLKSLKINPTSGPTGIDVLRTSIQQASSTLQDLVIYDIKLSQDEALIVIEALSQCPNLTFLRLQLIDLDIAIVDSMATNLPGLNRLDIWYNLTGKASTIASGVPMNRSSRPPRRLSAVYTDAESFRKAALLEGRSYPYWKLKDVSIYGGWWAQADFVLMDAFAVSVPTIKSFCGRGHMNKVDGEVLHRL